MGIRRTLTWAAGAFLMTTVLFAAAMVIAHSLIIPDPVRRVIPMTRQDQADASTEGATENVALVTDREPRPPETTDASDDVPEITAVPVPDDDPAAQTDGAGSPDADDRAQGSNDDAHSDDGDPAPAREVARSDPQERTGDADGGGEPRSQTEPRPQRPPGQASSHVVEPPAAHDDDEDRDERRFGRGYPRDDDDDDHDDWRSRRWSPRDDDDDDDRSSWRDTSREDVADRSASSLFDFFRHAGDGWSSDRDSFGQHDDDRDDRDRWR